MDDADPVGMYRAEIEKVPPLTSAEEAELTGRARSGDDEAKQRLTEGSLRLVVSIAELYADRGIALIDLIQEGNVGLVRAVEEFDARRDGSFSSYASRRIREAITGIVGQ
jgi:DNA-directed RNA polymerase sigma subunit (sigma70/sigma32)